MSGSSSAKNVSTVGVTKNLELIQKERSETKVINLKLFNVPEKPLVVLFSWLLAEKRHVYKYAGFYLDHGFDVLNVSILPWQLLWPVKGAQAVAADVLTFLDANPNYAPLMLHGFSVGGYLWGEVLVKIAAEKERYRHVIERILAQVWDSPADVTEIVKGVPLAVFPKNPAMQTALRQYMLYHLKTFDKGATRHYIRSSQMFHNNIIKAPALFLLSKTDIISSDKAIRRARENWEKMGIQVFWKCWNDSPHVGHFQQHKQEYIAELTNMLTKTGLIDYREKVQAKL